MDLYTDIKAFVRTHNGPTAEFHTKYGVLQGDTLSPLLFLLVVDYILLRYFLEEDSFLLALHLAILPCCCQLLPMPTTSHFCAEILRLLNERSRSSVTRLHESGLK